MSIVTLDPTAIDYIKQLQADASTDVAGIRVSVNSKGCSGLAYKFDYASEKQDKDEVIEDNGATLFLDPAAIMYVLGSRLYYRENDLSAGLSFENPNESGRCGCGESFFVDVDTLAQQAKS